MTSRTTLAVITLMSLSLLLELGCSKPPAPSEDLAATEETQAISPEDEARAVLTTTLDSWVLGDSIKKLREDHPEIDAIDERGSIRPFDRYPTNTDLDEDKANIVMLSHEIGIARELEPHAAREFGYNFIVVATVQDANHEILIRRMEYRVSKMKEPPTWSITGWSTLGL